MNVTFVGQQRKLEEVMCLQLTASSHGPHSKQHTRLWGRAFAWMEKYSSIARLSTRRGRKEEGRTTGRLAVVHQLLNKCQVHGVISSSKHTLSTLFERWGNKLRKGGVVLPRTQSEEAEATDLTPSVWCQILYMMPTAKRRDSVLVSFLLSCHPAFFFLSEKPGEVWKVTGLFWGQMQGRVTNGMVRLRTTEESRMSHRFLSWGQAQRWGALAGKGAVVGKQRPGVGFEVFLGQQSKESWGHWFVKRREC